MNKDKVYLEGYVIGHATDTLGYQGLLVQLENLDVVEIDKNLVHKKIDEPQLIKLKDVIARIEKFDLATKAVWINEILNKLGSDYGLHKYYAGYKQGKFDGTMEREKVTVPQFVGDFIAEQKKLGNMLSYSIDACMSDGVAEWYWDNSELFARAWLDGYEVEQEKRYEVKLKNTDDYLVKTNNDDYRFYNNIYTTRRKHTREEIEKAGFGWVFDCPGIEIEEVKG